MLEASQSVRGQLVGVARSLLLVYRPLTSTPTDDSELRIRGAVLDQLAAELHRLIGNAFQFRNDIGDPVQLALLILFMHGEELEMPHA